MKYTFEYIPDNRFPPELVKVEGEIVGSYYKGPYGPAMLLIFNGSNALLHVPASASIERCETPS